MGGGREPRAVGRNVGDDEPSDTAVVVDRGHYLSSPGGAVRIDRWLISIHTMRNVVMVHKPVEIRSERAGCAGDRPGDYTVGRRH